MAGRVAGDARPGVVACIQRASCAAAQTGVGGSHLWLAWGAHIVGVSSPSLPGALLEGCLSPSTHYHSKLFEATPVPLDSLGWMSAKEQVGHRLVQLKMSSIWGIPGRSAREFIPSHLKVAHFVGPHEHSQVLYDGSRLVL